MLRNRRIKGIARAKPITELLSQRLRRSITINTQLWVMVVGCSPSGQTARESWPRTSLLSTHSKTWPLILTRLMTWNWMTLWG